MKIDCSKTANFFKEVKRICDKYVPYCAVCPLDATDKGLTCHSFFRHCSQEAVEIVQKWSDEHPIKTRMDDLLEKYPKAVVNIIGGKPDICVKTLGYEENPKGCGHTDKCYECWNMPV